MCIIKYNFKKVVSIFLFLLYAISIKGQSTEQIYLSGTDKDHTVDWDFLVDDGRNSGKWSTIPVPSNWELQGFGSYNYGRDFKNPDRTISCEKGHYKYNFTVPKSWQNKAVAIVFEGSMTDTEIKINGMSAGPIHQGGFYEFRYDISNLLHYDTKNLLEVQVNKVSANSSVNAAEREADYWIFGGIYRPVYLEAKPKQNIHRVAINAQASGKFRMDVYLNNIKTADKVTAQVYDSENNAIGDPFSSEIRKGETKTVLNKNISNPKTWTAEHPNRYRVKARLSRNGNSIHAVKEKFGFRTIKIRKKDGIYVNGEKIRLKGVNHHSFWPSSGRTTSQQVSLLDVNLIKDMNMNAARMSHYPPDKHFLEASDSLGLYVLNELTGWQDAYDTKVGKKLVRELVIRDVNHPSVIFWDNGNEGGWNTDLDSEFSKYDPQGRPVLHPRRLFSGIFTGHYKPYKELKKKIDSKNNLVMPTEILHGLHDGGSGAGLNDYWSLIRQNDTGAGLFLWNFADEGIVRTDKEGEIDINRWFAPDGVVGPYRQKEGSFNTIKKIWAPVSIDDPILDKTFNGSLNIENRYFFTNLNQCHFKWNLVNFSNPEDKENGYKTVETDSILSPDIAPQSKDSVSLSLPNGWGKHDALVFTATDPHGREIYTWSWMIKKPNKVRKDIVNHASDSAKIDSSDDAYILLVGGETSISISRETSNVVKVVHNDSLFSFKDGPELVDGEAKLDSIKSYQENNKAVVEAVYKNEKKLLSG